MSTHTHGQLGVLKYPDPHVFGLHVEARDTGSACTAGACGLIKCHYQHHHEPATGGIFPRKGGKLRAVTFPRSCPMTSSPTFHTSATRHWENVAVSSRALIKHTDLLRASRKSFVRAGTSAKKGIKLAALSGVAVLRHSCK